MIAHLTVLVIIVGSGCLANNGSSNGLGGFGYELLLGRIEFLENTMKESQETLQRELRESQIVNKKLGDVVLRELQGFKSAFSSLDIDLKKVLGIRSCRDAPSMKSGIYNLKVISTAFEVYCEQNLYGGGWIVIQNRFDGSVDFFRPWNDYRNGFGHLDGEFWIGLEKIYLLTAVRRYELMIHLEDFNSVVKYAYYPDFRIGDEQNYYILNHPKLYNGTAGDSLSCHWGDKFSTRDRDNDYKDDINLAIHLYTGWWHANDYSTSNGSNLNGKYKNEIGDDTMSWRSFTGIRQGLKVSKMMIREV